MRRISSQRTFRASILISVGLLITGCASSPGLVTSLEDLNTETQREGRWKVPQYRTVSVPGLLPFSEVGGLYFYKTKRKPSSAIGLSPKDSFIFESVIEAKCDESCLIAVRNKLVKLRSLAEGLIDEKLNLRRVISQRPKPDASEEDNRSYRESVKSARKAYSERKNKFDEFYDDVAITIKHTGVIVYRWTTSTSGRGSLSLGSIFGGSADKDERYNGFALMSGIRMAITFLGKDLTKAWPNLQKSSRFSNRFELITHIQQARHILYVSEYDLQSLLTAKLDASYQQLSDISDTLKTLDRIEIEARFSKLSNLSNTGITGEAKIEIKPIDWTQTGLQDRIKNNNWQTFFSVQSDLTQLIKLLGHKTKNP